MPRMLRNRRSQVQIPELDSYFYNRNQFSITSGEGWLRPILCTVKWVKNSLQRWNLRDLAVEQPQLLRKLHQNEKNTLLSGTSTAVTQFTRDSS